MDRRRRAAKRAEKSLARTSKCECYAKDCSLVLAIGERNLHVRGSLDQCFSTITLLHGTIVTSRYK